ncbi:hypothetical protein EB796_014415 [Bugula neritina]|uniref:Uncharacterized protein n=1 Tax=Bugula neritina TaxID=10212 RepID=A0A7J7JPB7_BUGNE|nr:hypothetical protein EB796_014415 [Bugula neritina]
MPSTTLCTLKGVQPSPYSLKLLDLSLSILQTLTVGNFTISENIVGQWSAFHVLLSWPSSHPISRHVQRLWLYSHMFLYAAV